MSRPPVYKSLEVYHLSKKLVIACYELTHGLPREERTNFSRYIRTAALTAHVNIARGAFSKLKKRKKFFLRARMALIVIDAASEMLVEVGFSKPGDVEQVTQLSSSLSNLLDQF